MALNKQVSNLEIIDKRPFFTFHIERMSEGRFNHLVANMIASIRLYLLKLLIGLHFGVNYPIIH